MQYYHSLVWCFCACHLFVAIYGNVLQSIEKQGNLGIKKPNPYGNGLYFMFFWLFYAILHSF